MMIVTKKKITSKSRSRPDYESWQVWWLLTVAAAAEIVSLFEKNTRFWDSIARTNNLLNRLNQLASHILASNIWASHIIGLIGSKVFRLEQYIYTFEQAKIELILSRYIYDLLPSK